MKKYVHDIFAMANVSYKKSGLAVNIWSDGQGCTRNKPDVVPRVKLCKVKNIISVSIDPNPKVLVPKGNWEKHFTHSDVVDFEEGIEYIRRNYKTFLKHYNDTDLSFDDEDLFRELRENGQYR